MLEVAKVLQALENKRQMIVEEQEERALNEIPYHEYLSELERISEKEFLKKTNNKASARPVKFQSTLKQNFGNFDNIDTAISWAVNQFANSTITAIDGSQIMPSKELSYPIAMIQTGYFTIIFSNDFPNKPAETVSNTFPEILISSDSVISGAMLREGDVSLKRQSLEISTAKKLLDDLSKLPDPIILMDGTLIYSYMINLNPLTRQKAIDELVNFLQSAERHKIPVIGYIDTSYAKDLASTLLEMQSRTNIFPVSDGSILNTVLDRLGDYIIPFFCQREPIPEYGSYANKICFSYMRVNSVKVIRLEFPFWIWKSGRYESVMKSILAEAIVSHGYPRVLTRAHQTAVLNNADREKFHRIVLKYFNDHLDIPIKEMIKANMKRRFY